MLQKIKRNYREIVFFFYNLEKITDEFCIERRKTLINKSQTVVVEDSLISPSFINLFQDTKTFLSDSENLKQLIREGIKNPFDKIEREIAETIGEERTFRHAWKMANKENNFDYWLSPILLSVFSISEMNTLSDREVKKLNQNLSHCNWVSGNTKSKNEIDIQELFILRGLDFWEVVWDFSTETYLLKLNYSTNEFTQINLAKNTKNFFFTEKSIAKGYQFHWMNYLTLPVDSLEFLKTEKEIVKVIQPILLADIEKNIDFLKKSVLSPDADWVEIKPNSDSTYLSKFKIKLPFIFWNGNRTKKLLEKELWKRLEMVQESQHYAAPEILFTSYQKLIQTNKFKHYLSLIQKGVVNSPLSKTIEVFYKTVTVTDETYPEVVSEVKEYLYDDSYSEFKILQPFLLFLNPRDILEEPELKAIFIEGMKKLEFVTTKSYFSKLKLFEMKLSQTGTSINLKFDSENQLDAICCKFDTMIEIFKGISSEIDLDLPIDLTNQDYKNNHIVNTDILNQKTNSNINNFKQIVESLRTILGEDKLRKAVIGNYVLESLTLQKYQYHKELFDVLKFDNFHFNYDCKEGSEDVLSNIYNIPENQIHSKDKIIIGKTNFINFSNEEFYSKYFQDNVFEFLESLAAIATEKKKELS